MLCNYSSVSILEKNLIDANKSGLSWPELKSEADMIISTLKQSGQSLYDILPSGKPPADNTSKQMAHSPLSKSVTAPLVIDKSTFHRAASTTSTVTLAGLPCVFFSKRSYASVLFLK